MTEPTTTQWIRAPGGSLLADLGDETGGVTGVGTIYPLQHEGETAGYQAHLTADGSGGPFEAGATCTTLEGAKALLERVALAYRGVEQATMAGAADASIVTVLRRRILTQLATLHQVAHMEAEGSPEMFDAAIRKFALEHQQALAAEAGTQVPIASQAAVAAQLPARPATTKEEAEAEAEAEAAAAAALESIQ